MCVSCSIGKSSSDEVHRQPLYYHWMRADVGGFQGTVLARTNYRGKIGTI